MTFEFKVKAYDCKTMELIDTQTVTVEAEDRDQAKFWINHTLTCDDPTITLVPDYRTVKKSKEQKGNE